MQGAAAVPTAACPATHFSSREKSLRLPMGEIEVPADRYWGAQTQRSLMHSRSVRIEVVFVTRLGWDEAFRGRFRLLTEHHATDSLVINTEKTRPRRGGNWRLGAQPHSCKFCLFYKAPVNEAKLITPDSYPRSNADSRVRRLSASLQTRSCTYIQKPRCNAVR
jgi:hypothetical protein